MSDHDPVRLSKTLAFLLRHRPDVGDLELDADGWVALGDVCGAASNLLRYEVAIEHVRGVVGSSEQSRFEISDGRIRASQRQRQRGRTQQQRAYPPDILYHALPADAIDAVRAAGRLSGSENRQVFLSASESQAWRAAHRLPGSPRVLVVDAARARRYGVRFFRHRRSGMFVATPIPLKAVLSLLPGYAEQHSAGGFPVALGTDGVPRLALIQVVRRSGITWEVAKGKLEPGETPETTAIREVGEEMGIDTGMEVIRPLRTVRYGFLAPGGLPRLKIVYLYLLRPTEPITSFEPASGEGIKAVRWFDPEEAARAVTHSSLQPVMRHVRHLLRYGLPDPSKAGGVLGEQV